MMIKSQDNNTNNRLTIIWNRDNIKAINSQIKEFTCNDILNILIILYFTFFDSRCLNFKEKQNENMKNENRSDPHFLAYCLVLSTENYKIINNKTVEW